jgi:hypothetical protein
MSTSGFNVRAKVLNSTEDDHLKCVSTFETDEHLQELTSGSSVQTIWQAGKLRYVTG